MSINWLRPGPIATLVWMVGGGMTARDGEPTVVPVFAPLALPSVQLVRTWWIQSPGKRQGALFKVVVVVRREILGVPRPFLRLHEIHHEGRRPVDAAEALGGFFATRSTR